MKIYEITATISTGSLTTTIEALDDGLYAVTASYRNISGVVIAQTTRIATIEEI